MVHFNLVFHFTLPYASVRCLATSRLHIILIVKEMSKMKAWSLTNGIEALIFITLISFILLRNVDATGTVQTPIVKLINLLVLLPVLIVAVCIQMIWLHRIKKRRS